MIVNYRFLPWTRCGLVAKVEEVDSLSGALPRGRAAIKVAVSINSGAPIPAPPISTYGPGDVLGFDTRVIVRTEPRSSTTDFEPNYLAAVDFDTPDLPWMLTPARPSQVGGAEKLRPWLVLLVLDLERVALPTVKPARPLPSIQISTEAAATELPDLAEAWAWAHAQVALDAGFNGDLAKELAKRPDLNVSRLICPRRLAPSRRYMACLVPAFDQGVQRGLGGEPDPSKPLGPAWNVAVPAAIELPVYFHWEFSTAAGGDFEELARQITPMRAPASVGYQKVYLHPEELGVLRSGPDRPENYTWLEGPLRAPLPEGAPAPKVGERGAPRETLPAAFRDALQRRLDEPSTLTATKPKTASKPLAPPIYGGWPVNQQAIGSTPYAWLAELNLDPRQRVAAGLGSAVVQKNQEDFMQAAWEQVGDVVKANELLNRARLAQEVGERLFTRFFKGLPSERLTGVLAPMLGRVPLSSLTVSAVIRNASLPNAAFDPAMRRLVSPQRPWIKTALRKGGARAPGVAVNMVTTLNTAGATTDPTAFVPDGIAGSRAISRATTPNAAGLDFKRAGLDAKLTAAEAKTLTANAKAAVKLRDPGLPRPVLNPKLGNTGVLLAVSPRLTGVGQPGGNVGPGLAVPIGGPIGTPIGVPGTPVTLPPVVTPPVRLPPVTAPPITLPPVIAPPIALPPIKEPGVLERYREAFLQYVDDAGFGTPPIETHFVPLPLDQAKAALLERVNPAVAVRARIDTMLSLNGNALSQGFGQGVLAAPTLDRVLVGPKIKDAMYSYLASYDGERFLPGIGEIPQDRALLLSTNPRFVEAFMLGMNHEMNRELLFRNYPTDQRGTVFQKFWAWADGGEDIPEIHTWPAQRQLGQTARAMANGGQIVLLLRGQLLRRYPGTVVLACAGEMRDGQLRLKAQPVAADVLTPVFAGRFAPDFTFFGFSLTAADIQNGHWFFVLQEQPTEPRFGFDTPESDRSPALDSWLDATWADVGTAEGTFLRVAGSPLAGRSIGGVTYGRDAGHMAALLLQRPFRVAFDAKKMLARL
jgi:hypothetical protein